MKLRCGFSIITTHSAALTFFLRIAFLLLAFASVSYGQRLQPKKAKKYYQEAYKHYGFNNYRSALKYSLKALEKDSTHLNTLILLTKIYDITKLPEQELEIHYKILGLDSIDLRSHLRIGQLFLSSGDFESAAKKFRYLKRASWLPERYDKIIREDLFKCQTALYLMNSPKEVNRQKLGDGVNSDQDEYWPFLTPDEHQLYFTRKNIYAKNDSTRSGDENVFAASKKSENWVDGKMLPNYINLADNEGAQCITQDGKTMFFTVCKTSIREGCDIYITHFKNDRWQRPTKLPSPVNTPFKETQPSVSYDGKTLFFASNRPGGQGGLDIWVARMNKDSVWSNPVNLGKAVNTPSDEQSPFIHSDNQTLYFSSAGHPGMGNGDFFVIKLSNNAKALNIGYPINNHEMQLGIYVDLEGKFGYYASEDLEAGSGLDIYRFTLPDDVKPNPLKIIYGKVIDATTEQPIAGASLEVYNLDKNIHVVNYTAHKDGSFKFGLPGSTQFGIMADAKGYIPLSLNSAVDTTIDNQQVLMKLWPIAEGGAFTLENIFFDFDSSSLKVSSLPEINYLADFLEKYPHIKIEIGGHTDNIGGETYNQQLSEKRAIAVLKALEKEMEANLGDRISIKGYGDQQPVAANDTEEGRQLNRRTEIKILQIN